MKVYFRSQRVLFSAGILTFSFLVTIWFQNCGSKGFITPNQGWSNTSSLGASSPTLKDPTKAGISIQSDKAEVTQFNEQTFTFNPEAKVANDVVTYRCKLNSLSASACSSPWLLKDIPEGVHTLNIEGSNSAGTVIAQNAIKFTVDRTSPSLSFNQVPGGISGSGSAQFVFTAVDSLTSIKEVNCSLDGQANKPTQSPYITASLPEGDHVVTCQATDAAENLSSIISKSWTISLNVPSITLDVALPNFSKDRNKVLFTTSTSTKSALEITCSLDGGAFVSCASGYEVMGLSSGPHSITVNARDVLTRQSSAYYSWNVDLSAPNVNISSPVKPATNLKSFPIEFSVNDGIGSGMGACECAILPGAYTTCTSPFNLTTTVDGSKTASVRCQDKVGNVSTAANQSILFDQTSPSVDFTTATVALTTSNSATFNLSGADALSMPLRYFYKLDSDAFTQTSSVLSLSGLSDGAHTVLMKSVDDVGNESLQKPFSWSIDTMPPNTPTAINFSNLGNDAFVWNAATDTGSGVSFYELKVGTSPGAEDLIPSTKLGNVTSYSIPYNYIYNSSTAEYTFEGRVVYVSVRATDRAGYIGSWGSSGPTSKQLFDRTYALSLTGEGGPYLLLDKLNTSVANLSANIQEYTPSIIINGPATKGRISDTVSGSNTLVTITRKTPGTLTATCQVDQILSACDPVNGIDFSNIPPDSPKKMKVVVYYNGEVFFQTEKTILRTAKYFLPYGGESFTSSDILALKSGNTGGIYDVSQFWLEASLFYNIDNFCWNPVAGTKCVIVVAKNSYLRIGQLNPFVKADAKVYVGSGASFLLQTGKFNELHAAADSDIYVNKSRNPVLITKVNLLADTIPSAVNCPYSKNGNGCPAGLQTIK